MPSRPPAVRETAAAGCGVGADEGSVAPHDGVRGRAGVVGARVVEGVVQAAAFVAADGALDDQRGGFDEVAQFEQFAGDAEVPVELLDLALEVAQAGGSGSP